MTTTRRSVLITSFLKSIRGLRTETEVLGANACLEGLGGALAEWRLRDGGRIVNEEEFRKIYAQEGTFFCVMARARRRVYRDWDWHE